MVSKAQVRNAWIGLVIWGGLILGGSVLQAPTLEIAAEALPLLGFTLLAWYFVIRACVRIHLAELLKEAAVADVPGRVVNKVIEVLTKKR